MRQMDPLVFISLLIATPLVWLSWIFQSGFSRSQRIVYLTVVLAYFVALAFQRRSYGNIGIVVISILSHTQ